MRPVRKISAEEENFRMESLGKHPDKPIYYETIRRDPVEPEPVGTIIMRAFRITGYDPDCDGSLMARLESLSVYDGEIEETGWIVKNTGLYPESCLVVTENELKELFADCER